jgi:hypothetical protein
MKISVFILILTLSFFGVAQNQHREILGAWIVSDFEHFDSDTNLLFRYRKDAPKLSELRKGGRITSMEME